MTENPHKILWGCKTCG